MLVGLQSVDLANNPLNDGLAAHKPSKHQRSRTSLASSLVFSTLSFLVTLGVQALPPFPLPLFLSSLLLPLPLPLLFCSFPLQPFWKLHSHSNGCSRCHRQAQHGLTDFVVTAAFIQGQVRELLTSCQALVFLPVSVILCKVFFPLQDLGGGSTASY